MCNKVNIDYKVSLRTDGGNRVHVKPADAKKNPKPNLNNKITKQKNNPPQRPLTKTSRIKLEPA